MVNSRSVLGIKPVYFGNVIGYQVHEFTCTWSVEHFVAQSYIYLAFTVMLLTLAYFLLESSCEDYSVLFNEL